MKRMAYKLWREESSSILTAIFAVLFFVIPDLAYASTPQGINLQGRLIKPDGSSVESTTVDFLLQVRSPGAENCILYEESHTLNMLGSDGIFTIRLGTGTRTGATYKDTSSLKEVFDNSLGSIGSLTCVSGTTFDPSAGDFRKLRISFDDGSGVQTLAQDQAIQSVPFALYADSVQGKSASDLVQTVSALEAAPGTTQSRFNRIIDTDWAGLDALLLGTSSLYAKATPSAAVSNNGQRFINVADPTAAQDAATKNYADTKIGGNAATIGVLAPADAGKAITWDGTKWVASAVSTTDNTKVAKTGDSMTGSLGIGAATPPHRLSIYDPANDPARIQIATSGTQNAQSVGLEFVTKGDGAAILGTVPGHKGWQFDARGDAFQWPIEQNDFTINYFDGVTWQPTIVLDAATRNVGIGTATPATTLDVNGATTLRGNVAITSTTAATDKVTGALTVAGGLGVSGLAFVDRLSSTGGLFTQGAVNNVYAPTDSSKAWPYESANPAASIYSLNNGSVDGNGAFLALRSRNLAGNGQNAYLGSVSTTGAGIYSPSIVLGHQTGATAYAERMRIDSLGNVGVGTTTPNGKLDVKGSMVMSGATSGYVGFQPAAAAGSTIYTLPAAPVAGNVLSTDATGNLSWIAAGGGGTGDFKADGSVNMTGPIRAANGSTGAPPISFASDPDTGFQPFGANTMAISLGNARYWYISPSNGINNATPGGPSLGSTAGSSSVPSLYFSGMGSVGLYAPAANTLAVVANSAERLRVNSDGKVGINTTAAANGQLDVKGSIVMSGATSGYAGFQPATAAGSTVWTLPAADGSANQVLKTDGAGVLGWATNVTVGQTAGTAMGADAVPQCTGAQKLQMSAGPTFGWTCVADASTDATKVAKAGDTMTGTLNLPANGLIAGTTQLVLASGNVGVGTASPSAKLDVGGQVRSASSSGSSTINAAFTVDWNNGNNQALTSDCSSPVVFSNMLDGGTYNLAATSTISTNMCVFSQGALQFHYTPANGTRVNGLHTFYSFTRIGDHVYVAWSSMNP